MPTKKKTKKTTKKSGVNIKVAKEIYEANKNVAPKAFSMDCFMKSEIDGGSCHTRGCALGNFIVSPKSELEKAKRAEQFGFGLVKRFVGKNAYYELDDEVNPKDINAFAVAAKLLNIDLETAESIFGADNYHYPSDGAAAKKQLLRNLQLLIDKGEEALRIELGIDCDSDDEEAEYQAAGY